MRWDGGVAGGRGLGPPVPCGSMVVFLRFGEGRVVVGGGRAPRIIGEFARVQLSFKDRGRTGRHGP